MVRHEPNVGELLLGVFCESELFLGLTTGNFILSIKSLLGLYLSPKPPHAE